MHHNFQHFLVYKKLRRSWNIPHIILWFVDIYTIWSHNLIEICRDGDHQRYGHFHKYVFFFFLDNSTHRDYVALSSILSCITVVVNYVASITTRIWQIIASRDIANKTIHYNYTKLQRLVDVNKMNSAHKIHTESYYFHNLMALYRI